MDEIKTGKKDRPPETDIRRVTWWGFALNILLAVFKMVAGWLGHSQAVVADGIHSLTDTATDVAVIMGSYYWSQPADETHPYGHKRLETTVSIFIGGMLVMAGAGIGWEALGSIFKAKMHQPRPIAFAAAAISIVAKEGLYQWTRRVGRRLNSASLNANAWHHRVDAFSSIPVLVAVGVTLVVPAWHLVDHVAALLVCLLVCLAAGRIILAGFKELVDEGAPPEVCEQIKRIVRSHPEVSQVHNVRTRYAGSHLRVDLHLVVDGQMTVYEGHMVAEAVKKLVLTEGPDVIDVEVHVEPLEAAKPEDEC